PSSPASSPLDMGWIARIRRRRWAAIARLAGAARTTRGSVVLGPGPRPRDNRVVDGSLGPRLALMSWAPPRPRLQSLASRWIRLEVSQRLPPRACTWA